MTGQAAGAGGWLATDLLRQPQEWKNRALELWRQINDFSIVPKIWSATRVALIPKPEAGSRPIAVTSVLWRAFCRAELAAHKKWIRKWSTTEMIGGIPGKAIHTGHDRVVKVIEDCRQRGAICAEDLSRCFGRTHAFLALLQLRSLGLDANLVRVATDFYGNVDKYMISGNCTGKSPISLPGHSRLLQGCPLSVAALNDIMVMWLEQMTRCRTHHEEAGEPQNETRTIYVDDRVTLCWGDKAVENLNDYLKAAERIDANMGSKSNKDNFKMAVSDDQLRRKVLEAGTLKEEQIKDSVTILGIVVHANGDRPPHLPGDAVLRAERRCSIVGMVPGTAAFRARLLRTWAFSPAVWAAGHGPLSQKQVKTPTQG